MSSQKSFTPTGLRFDDVDALETIRRETAESAMDDAAFFKASDRPDETRLNAAIEGLRVANLATRAANIAFANQMEANGYRLESTGSYEDEERHFVHHTVGEDWDEGLWGDSKGLVARRLVVKF